MTAEEYDNMMIDSIIENNEWYAKLLIDSEQENCEGEIETCLNIARWLRELKERRKNDVKVEVKSDNNVVNSEQ